MISEGLKKIHLFITTRYLTNFIIKIKTKVKLLVEILSKIDGVDKKYSFMQLVKILTKAENCLKSKVKKQFFLETTTLSIITLTFKLIN